MYWSIERYIYIGFFYSIVSFFFCYYFNFSIYYIKRFLESDMRMRWWASSWRNQHVNNSISIVGLFTAHNNPISISYYRYTRSFMSAYCGNGIICALHVFTSMIQQLRFVTLKKNVLSVIQARCLI